MAEISDAELDTLRKAQKLLDGIWSDPTDGLAFKRMVKKRMPDSRIPELDIAEPMMKTVTDSVAVERTEREKLQKRLDDRDKEDRERKEMSDMTSALSAAQKEYRLTDDGMEKVKKRMRDTNNPDPAAAAAWVTDHEPKTTPVAGTSYSPSDINLFGSSQKSDDEEIQALHKDPIRWADQKAYQLIDAINRGENIEDAA